MNNLWDAVVYAAAHDLLYVEVAIFCYTVILPLIGFRLRSGICGASRHRGFVCA
ncbi:hypothetical protein [Salinisphaera shabanensis]|jgi:hypothetical protein|uniref:hypothetical protein n=1 Tax=Salinisphaera shabanensis TaxID=180542 RepID=UPI00333E9B71